VINGTIVMMYGFASACVPMPGEGGIGVSGLAVLVLLALLP